MENIANQLERLENIAPLITKEAMKIELQSLRTNLVGDADVY